MTPKYLTLIEAAVFLKVHPDTVRRWTKENKINSVRIGNKILVSEDDVQSMIQPQSQEVSSNV